MNKITKNQFLFEFSARTVKLALEILFYAKDPIVTQKKKEFNFGNKPK